MSFFVLEVQAPYPYMHAQAPSKDTGGVKPPEMKHIWGSQMAQAVLGEMSLLGWEHGALAGRERQRTELNLGVTGRSTRKKSQRTAAYIHRNKQHF